MNIFLKAAAGAIVATLLGITISKQSKDFSFLIILASCCFVIAAVASFIDPIIAFLHELQDLANLEDGLLLILIKSVGISLIAEFSAQMCVDGGNASLGKMIHYLASATIIWLSIPLFRSLIDMISNVLVTI